MRWRAAGSVHRGLRARLSEAGGKTVLLKEGATGYVVDPGDARTPRLPTIRTMFAGAPIVVTAKRQGEAHWENMGIFGVSWVC